MKKILLILLFSLLALSLHAQTNPVQGQTFVWTAEGEYDGVVYNFSSLLNPVFTFQYNSITSNATSGHLLRIGTEAPSAYDENMNGSIIRGNYLEYNGNWDPIIITHGLFTGHNRNIEMWYNKLVNNPLGLIMKNEDPAIVAQTTGGVFYNYVYGGLASVSNKGVGGMKIYNNTFYFTQNITQTWRAAVYIHPGVPYVAATNCEIYNNVFYMTGNAYPLAVFVEDVRDTVGLKCDYNVYWATYGPSNAPRFKIGGTIYSWAQWRAFGYDAHSVIVNPQLNINGIPAISLPYGKNLGATYQTGLKKDATWVIGSSMSTTTQSGTWQVGAFINESTPPSTDAYYVAVNGNDSNDGSIGSPWKTWQKGFDMAYSTKKIVYIRGGNYGSANLANSGLGTSANSVYSAVWETGKNGTPTVPIRVRAYQPDLDAGSRPVMNCTSMTSSSSHFGIYLDNCDYWQVYGLKIVSCMQASGYGGHVFYIKNGNYNLIEFCEAAWSGGSGITVYLSSTGNIIKNFDAHHCYDNYTGGENADGIEIAEIPFNTTDMNNPLQNWLIGCRSWRNSDDGYDFYDGQCVIYMDSCWAFSNNFVTGTTIYPAGGGDGNGFKLGKANWSDAGDPIYSNITKVHRYLYNCLAVGNENMGFSQSNCNFNQVLSNCTGIGNRLVGNYHFSIARADTLRNNLSYAGSGQVLQSSQVQITNKWTGDATITSLDFESLDTALLDAPRSSRGKLPYVKYGRPVSTSELRNAGTIVASVDDDLPERDNTYYGTKPDIGWLDYNEGGAPVIPVPTLTTTFVSTNETSAQVGGNAVSDGGATVTQKGVCWASGTQTPTTANSKTQEGGGTGGFVSTITGLTPNTTYWARAYAINSAGTGYGSVLSFTTDETGFIMGGFIKSDQNNFVKNNAVFLKSGPRPILINLKDAAGAVIRDVNSQVINVIQY